MAIGRFAFTQLVFLLLLSTTAGAGASDAAEVSSAATATQYATTQVSTAKPEVETPVLIGLDADLSKGAAQGGEAIRRGVLLAIGEINASGGVLGRRLELVSRDHRGIPARGIDNINEFARMKDLVAVVGGVHTPVALAELDAIHQHQIIYLGPWAAGTPVVQNNRDPNFVFRVSVSDDLAGGFLVEAARQSGFRRLGLLLWRTGWGRSNEKAIASALSVHGDAPARVEWFNSGQKDLSREIDALLAAGSDVIILVANPVEGEAVVKELARRPAKQRLPVISHWGITGGDFHGSVADALAVVDLSFLQTFSFFDPPFPEKTRLFVQRYCTAFGNCSSAEGVISPVGTAHAYDLVHILKRAIEAAGTVDRAAVRREMERLGRYEGLVRIYDPPFDPSRHDALDATDFRLSRFSEDGTIIPIARK